LRLPVRFWIMTNLSKDMTPTLEVMNLQCRTNPSMANMTPSLGLDDEKASAVLTDPFEVVLWFGCITLNAGGPAFRVREWMEELARKMRFDALSVSFTLNGIIASVHRGSERATLMREIEPPGVNSWKIGELERLAHAVRPGQSSKEVALKISKIEATPPRYSTAQTAAAMGAACGAFAFLNGGGGLEVLAAGIGGAGGQWLRSLLLSRTQINHFGITTLCAIAASGIYALIAIVSTHIGLSNVRHTAGLISSVLFLLPGFPLVAALLDLLKYQTLVAVTRFAHSAMILLAAIFGLSFVVAVIGFDVSPPPTPTLELSEPVKLLLRAIASFAGGCGFAILYNSSSRAVFAVGLLALGANELRLALHDAGMMLAPATFLGALAVGLVASIAHRPLKEPRIAITVPSIIIMVPGLYAVEMIVLFNQGHMLDSLQAAASFSFVIGGMAMGLAVARLISERVPGSMSHSSRGQRTSPL